MMRRTSGRGEVILSAFMVMSVLGALLVTSRLAAAQGTNHGQVVFTKDIAPVLQRSCERCHRTNGVGPMPLTTYEQVRPWARAIQQKTAAREMPPWYIEKNIGIQRFKNDPSLTDEEIAKITRWVESGAPRGNPADMPPPRRYANDGEWTIGKPDLIVSSPVITVKAVAPDWYALLGPSPSGVAENRYIEAVEIREVRMDGAGMGRVEGRKEGDLNYFTVHHAGIHEVHPREDPEGITRAFARDGVGDGNFYIVHQLGANATVYPSDTGVLLKAGAEFTYSVHMHSIGKEAKVRIDVGFKFRPKGWTPKYRQDTFVLMGNLTDELDIPANQDNVRFDVFYRMRKPGLLTTFEPHMHSSGKRMCVEALYPDGKREMLNCSGYNHNWVLVYSYEEDVIPILPKDTVLHIIGWYNNTASNPRTIEPRNTKVHGQRSIDDMLIFQPRITWLTDEQFKEAIAEREAHRRRASPTAGAGQ